MSSQTIAHATATTQAGNLLKLKKAAEELFSTKGMTPTDLCYLKVPIAHLLTIATKSRKLATEEKETYTAKDGSEKTRAVKKDENVIQLTLRLDEFFDNIGPIPSDDAADYRVTPATLPTGGITSRIILPQTKKARAPKKEKKASPATPATPATPAAAAATAAAAAAAPGAPKKAARSPKKAKAPKMPAMPVLTDEQLSSILSADPKLAKKAQKASLKPHFERLGVAEKDYKQARIDWIAYRATHEPEVTKLLDTPKLEHLRALNMGNRPQLRNKKLIAALESWGITDKATQKTATEEYKAWAKEVGIGSAKSSKPSSPKASPKASAAAAPAAAPAAETTEAPAAAEAPKADLSIRTPTAADESGSDSDSDSDSEDDETPVATQAMYGTALEAIGDAEDIGAFE